MVGKHLERVVTENLDHVDAMITFVVTVLNVAAGKAPMQSSVMDGGIPQKAIDGSTSTFYDPKTCSLTEVERAPWWYVNLLEPYMVQLVRVDFGQSCCGNKTLYPIFTCSLTYFEFQPRIRKLPLWSELAITDPIWE